MTEKEALELLLSHRSDRGLASWRRLYPDSPLIPLGIGLTRLRQLAKKVGRDAELAAKLWVRPEYEARVLSLLIDDPKRMTVEQAEAQVEQLGEGQLSHVFSSCDATLAKTAFVAELAERWTVSDDPVRRCCGFGLVYELSKVTTKSAPNEACFAAHIARIDETWAGEPTDVRMSMATALMGMGRRSGALWPDALRVARDIGPIDFDPTGSCDPWDVVKHLDNPGLREKLGV